MRVSRPKKPKGPKKEKPVRDLTPEERHQQYWQLMLTVVKLWLTRRASSSTSLSCLKPASSYTTTDLGSIVIEWVRILISHV